MCMIETFARMTNLGGCVEPIEKYFLSLFKQMLIK